MGAETTVLPAWESFYVIIGTSAAALTGLQFVVITLVIESRSRDAGRAISAFGTPTVLHFCAVVLISGILSAPWESLTGPAIGLAGCGIGGLFYAAVTIRRILRQKIYRPVFEDWLSHVILPIVAYSSLLVAAFGIRSAPMSFLFLTAAAVLVLLFDGIHNAWDTVVFLAETGAETGGDAAEEPASPVAGEGRAKASGRRQRRARGKAS